MEAITTVDEAIVKRFAALFQGNARNHGQYGVKDRTAGGRMSASTIKGPVGEDRFQAHLEGEMGIGVIPVLDDDTCWFAVIDIDTHGPQGKAVDIFTIEERVRRLELPLVVCRSKSGGAHCYVFFETPQPATDARVTLTRWETMLGYPGAEIFPKQNTLHTRDSFGNKLMMDGNWINLPYFNVAETNRYCVDGGKEVSLDYFLSLAEGKRCLLEQFLKQAQSDFEGGPPCLQKMFETKVEEGVRNTAVFQAGVFLRRAYPDDWRPRIDLFNKSALTTPLALREVRSIQGSVARKEYQYKCREEPCRSLCNRELCKTRPFGITDADERANEVPPIDKVIKVVSTPISWELTIRGKFIRLTTPQLFNYDTFRQAVFEQLHVLMPPMKKNEWDLYLRDLTQNIEISTETTIEDIMMQRAVEFCRRARSDKNEPEDTRREALRRGMPALIAVHKLESQERDWFYAFKLLDFVEYLKRRKALIIPEYQVSSLLLRVFGPEAKRAKIRVGGTTVANIWCVPEQQVSEEPVPEIKPKTEF